MSQDYFQSTKDQALASIVAKTRALMDQRQQNTNSKIDATLRRQKAIAGNDNK